MGDTRIVGDVALTAYLRLVCGREPASSFVELRPLLADGMVALRHRKFLHVSCLYRLQKDIVGLGPEMNVFVGVAPRVRREGVASAIERCWTLWVDVDEPENLGRLAAFRPLPSMVVRSGGGGVHAYWPLREPLAPALLQRANRRLALAVGGDMNATDAARILRPPSTFNHKRSPPVAVVCTRLEDVAFLAAQVVGGLPDTDHYRRRAAVRHPSPADSPRAEKALKGLVLTVANAAEGGRNSALFWAACCGLEYVDGDGWSERRTLDALGGAAFEAGLGDPEIRAVFASARRTVRNS